MGDNMTTAATRDKLIEAFFFLAKEKNVKKITITDVAKTAGVHRSTFYEYFIDILDLLEQEENEILQLQKELIIEPIQSSQADTFDLGTVIPRLVKVYEFRGQRIATLIGPNGDPHFREAFIKNMRPQLIKLFNLENDVYNDYLIEFLSSGLIAIINKAYTEPRISVAELAQFIYPMVAALVGISKV